MKLLLILGFAISLNCFSKTKFGEDIKLTKAIAMDVAIKNMSKSEVLVKATVGKVCKKKGCWMTLNNSQSEYRVTFKDYGFFVPFSLVGKEVLVQGKIEKKVMSLKETRHYIEDEGGDPSKVTKGRTEYRIVASGVKVIK